MAYTPVFLGTTDDDNTGDAPKAAGTKINANFASIDTQLAAKAPIASPTLTGTPAAPTAAVDTNTTQVATTAFVVGQAGSANPVINGTAAPGTSLRYARADHVHPTDTTRAPLASPTFTGTPSAPTPANATNTTQIATTAWVKNQGYTTSAGSAVVNWVSVKALGAVGDGVTDDTAAFSAACTAVNTATGGIIYVPKGKYLVNMNTITLKSRTGIVGDGGASQIYANGTGGAGQWLIDISGTDEGTRTERVMVRDIHLEGNNITAGRCIRSYYAGLVYINNVSCWYWPDGFIYAVDMWDSRIRDCQVDWPCWNSGWAFWFKNADAPTGFGSSTTATNQVHVSGIRIETNVHGGIRVECGNNSSPPNTCYFYDIKIESYSWTNEGAIYIGDQCRAMKFRDIYLAFGNWSSGTTALDAVYVGATTGDVTFDSLNCYQQTAGMLNTVFSLNGAAGTDRYYNIAYSGLNNSPIQAVIKYNSGVQPIVRGIEAYGLTGVNFVSGVTGYALTDATTITIPAHLDYDTYRVTLTASRTFALPTGMVAGWKASVFITQGTGGSKVATWNSGYKFGSGSSVLSTTAGLTDRLDLYYDGVILTATLAKGF